MPRGVGASTPTPFELSYSSKVIWKLILVRRFLTTSIRCSNSIRRFIEPPFYSGRFATPLFTRDFAFLESGTQNYANGDL
jgi:hypothetical protein